MRDLAAFVQGTGLPLRQNSRLRSGVLVCHASPPSQNGSNHAANGSDSDHSQPQKKQKPQRTIKSSATWANVFLPEFGSKGPGSRPHADLRPMSLRTEEEGKGICDNCDGTGVTVCSFCNGLDIYAADGSEVICPACNGEKYVTCTVCFGTGKEIELTENWWEKGVAALFKS